MGAGAGTSSAGAGMSSVISSLSSESIESETEELCDFVWLTRLLGILLTDFALYKVSFFIRNVWSLKLSFLVNWL